MYFLVYVSSAAKPFSDEELTQLLEVSRRNNTARGITGMLLYSDGNFMQVLEGTEEQVNSTHLKIAADPRHRGLITLLKGERENRDFADWSMGFKKLDGPEALAIPGYSDFLNSRFTGADFTQDPSKSLRLLGLFKKNMR